MSRQWKVSYEDKLQAVDKYKRGEGGLATIAAEYGVSQSSFRQWLNKYDSMGPDGLRISKTHKRYEESFKRAAVEAYLNGEGSQREICKRFKLSGRGHLQDWIEVYNGHKKFQSTDSHGSEIIMTKGRKTTLEERIEIVSFCIENEKDYAKAIEKYQISYQQLYSWVKKYEGVGVEGLTDKRGKRKDVTEMTEVERLRAENRMLHAENKRKEMEIEILKKVQEVERRRG